MKIKGWNSLLKKEYDILFITNGRKQVIFATKKLGGESYVNLRRAKR